MSLYVRLGTNYQTDEKVMAAGPMAELLWIRGLCWSKERLTDGYIPVSVLTHLAAKMRSPARLAALLVDVGLWETCEGGWRVPYDRWQAWQVTKDQVEDLRRKRAEAGKKGNEARWGVANESQDDRKCDPICEPVCDAVAMSASSPELRPQTSDLMTPRTANRDVVSAEIETVFAAWTDSTGRTGSKLDPKRRKLIGSALKQYPVEDLVDAVRGWRHIPHNRGENERRTVYNDLNLLLRDAEHIERFRDHERQAPSTVAAVDDPIARVLGQRPRLAVIEAQGRAL